MYNGKEVLGFLYILSLQLYGIRTGNRDFILFHVNSSVVTIVMQTIVSQPSQLCDMWTSASKILLFIFLVAILTIKENVGKKLQTVQKSIPSWLCYPEQRLYSLLCFLMNNLQIYVDIRCRETRNIHRLIHYFITWKKMNLQPRISKTMLSIFFFSCLGGKNATGLAQLHLMLLLYLKVAIHFIQISSN